MGALFGGWDWQVDFSTHVDPENKVVIVISIIVAVSIIIPTTASDPHTLT